MLSHKAINSVFNINNSKDIYLEVLTPANRVL